MATYKAVIRRLWIMPLLYCHLLHTQPACLSIIRIAMILHIVFIENECKRERVCSKQSPDYTTEPCGTSYVIGRLRERVPPNQT